MSEILDHDFHEVDQPGFQRRDLPWWMRFFCWVFMLLGLMVPVGFVSGWLGIPFGISLYGLNPGEPLSILGIIVLLLFALKAVVAYGLWMEKPWSIKLGIVDGGLGLLICFWVSFVFPFTTGVDQVLFSFRLEIVFLLLYLYQLFQFRRKLIGSRGWNG